MLTLYLGSDWNVARDEILSDGVAVDAIEARGFLSTTADGAAINPQLEDTDMVTSGDFKVVLQGTYLRTYLEPMLDAAELLGRELVVYDRVVVDDEDYSDYVAVRVKRSRPAGEP